MSDRFDNNGNDEFDFREVKDSSVNEDKAAASSENENKDKDSVTTVSGSVEDTEKSKTDNDKKESEYEDVCFMCRRPESKAGKMFHLPNGICVCDDCMHKTMDTVSQYDYQNLLNNPNLMNELNKHSGIPGLNFMDFGDFMNTGGIPNSQKIKKKKEETAQVAAPPEREATQERQAAPERSNTGGWQGILTGLGLNGISDIGRNAGYILAMLPDMLLGMFTGKTQSLGIRENLVPIASIMAGLFVKNPLLKMTLIGLGGANLINKAGHEQLAKRDEVFAEPTRQNRYLQYENQEMNPRIRDAQIQGNTLIASIDGIPVTVTLPEKVVEAHAVGALPLGTLANAVLEKCDRMQEVSEARDRFEEESRTQTRGVTQR